MIVESIYTKSNFVKEYVDGIHKTIKDLEIDNCTTKEVQQPKPITNQDDSYKYSKALKLYNDIILAFESEYQN